MSILDITRFNNVQIPKPLMRGHLPCQAAFAVQKERPVIAGSTVYVTIITLIDSYFLNQYDEFGWQYPKIMFCIMSMLLGS